MVLRGSKKQIACALVLLGIYSSASAAVELGLDVLADNSYAQLRGKRVGLITNQTGVNSRGIRTRVVAETKL
jgi:uncharacterized protein YbbC (DUF1343 family)